MTTRFEDGDGREDSRRQTDLRVGWIKGSAILVAVTGALVVLAGRSSEDVGEEASSRAASSSAGEVASERRPGMAVSGPEAVDLSGTWAHRSVQTSLADVAVAGEVEATTTTLRVTEIQQKGSELTLRSETCDSRVESNFDRIRTEIPDAFIETAPVAERPGRLVVREGRLRLSVPERCSVRGARADDPERAALPTSPADERVHDGDGDGEPGVTIRVEGMVEGKMFLVQRGCDSYRGRVISEARIRGHVDWSTEQTLLEATSMFLSAPKAEPHPDEAEHTFEMRRLESSTTCDELVSRAEEIFGGE